MQERLVGRGKSGENRRLGGDESRTLVEGLVLVRTVEKLQKALLPRISRLSRSCKPKCLAVRKVRLSKKPKFDLTANPQSRSNYREISTEKRALKQRESRIDRKSGY